MSKLVSKVVVTVNPSFRQGDSVKAPDDFRSRFSAAGWSDDPGTGKAVLTTDGREVLNPVPFAPPVGYVESPDVMTLIQQQVQRHLLSLKGEDEIDSPEDWEDFDVVEELDPWSVYEVREMIEEAPALRPAPPPQDASSAPESGAATQAGESSGS